MDKNDNFEDLSIFLRFLMKATDGLSKDSKEKVLAADTWRRASECKSSQDFLRFIESMALPELKGKKFGDAKSEIVDDFLKSGKIPSLEEAKKSIERYQSETPKTKASLWDDVSNGALLGAAQGAATGGVGGIWATPVAGVGGPAAGAGLGAIVGGVAGAIGGAVGHYM